MVRNIDPDIPAVYVDTGLEYPENRSLVKATENTIILKPEMPFKKVIDTFGYPIISKKISQMLWYQQNPTPANAATRKLNYEGIRRDGKKTTHFKMPEKYRYLITCPFRFSNKCCDIMKKNPLHKYEKETDNRFFVGTMASDSQFREVTYLNHGCNNLNTFSSPLSIWTKKDVWDYIHLNNIPYSTIYDKGETSTGCMFCLYGITTDHLRDPNGLNRIQRMSITHPPQYKFCIEVLKLGKIMDLLNLPWKIPFDIFGDF